MNPKTDYDRYETPEVLVTDPKLSAAQKIARLEAWEEDLKAGLRASDESMTSLEPRSDRGAVAESHRLPGAVAKR
jgi:hypothetical protein